MPQLLSPGEAQRKRRTQTKLQVAKLSARESDRRKDWIEKTTTNLVREYDLIAIEDLQVLRIFEIPYLRSLKFPTR